MKNKFYWLEAIVDLISENVTDTTFDAVIDEMIANAWYSVVEFHVHLSGTINREVKDGLERAVLKLHELSELSGNASKRSYTGLGQRSQNGGLYRIHQ